MPNKSIYSFALLCFWSLLSFSQEDKPPEDVSTKNEVQTNLIRIQDSVKTEPLNVLAPAKAAFYSAVLPGLGQAYNKKYWKIPLVYAAIGIPAYFYVSNDKEYKRVRDAYKDRLAGVDQSGTEFANVSNDGLIRAQRGYRRNKELALLLSIVGYALNIIDANVDAHLMQFNVDENLSLRPHIQYNQRENASDVGLTLNFKF
ncbi:hypothetical protein ESY86_00625 [Subsaximicrobium wynnwilliamsii]|uniref:DUF5683 domain-containing protein n=1 Tax=Subsaximicrobium wynnwilliamsii TaxID=291179 RepID=A0A5C6ZMR7_9FLAO|nr:DUF5683 domain-containing protein [Subsaximicrobium wynnwilliamsii]TXD85086.1 hypothetical protein ESY87_01795 [Subsaximicrobium wynnwilliamsii]TXD91129.1 hypothetical protein ESY86_00625 [Subsaximicrobium wynnwilliamsii]TXE04523.1 hypothetical protein ESY88_03275 [Subsaximicrobium wynnwilliamsii]